MLRVILTAIASLLVSIFVFLWAEDQVALSFQACISQHEREQSSTDIHKNSDNIVLVVKARISCSIRLIDRHNGFFALLAALLVTVFTGVLSYFTISLAKSTRVAADAAKHAAMAAVTQARVAEDTLTKIQRPYIYIFGVAKMAGIDTQSLKYTVANYGQSSAIITRINVGFSEELIEIPGRVDPDHDLVIDNVMPTNGKIVVGEALPSQHIDNSFEATFDRLTRATPLIPKVTQGNTLYFRVLITYSGPLPGSYETSATWEYVERNGIFIAVDNKKYSYMK